MTSEGEWVLRIVWLGNAIQQVDQAVGDQQDSYHNAHQHSHIRHFLPSDTYDLTENWRMVIASGVGHHHDADIAVGIEAHDGEEAAAATEVLDERGRMGAARAVGTSRDRSLSARRAT